MTAIPQRFCSACKHLHVRPSKRLIPVVAAEAAIAVGMKELPRHGSLQRKRLIGLDEFFGPFQIGFMIKTLAFFY